MIRRQTQLLVSLAKYGMVIIDWYLLFLEIPAHPAFDYPITSIGTKYGRNPASESAPRPKRVLTLYAGTAEHISK